ncbi:MAG: hypothetical protein WCL70_14130 [Paludibacter sp.]
MKNLLIPTFCVVLLLSFTACNLDDILTPQHTIHVVADANAVVTPSSDQKVKHNSDLTINMSAKAGCNIDSVLVDGVNIGVVKSYTFKNITTDHSITVKASTKVFYTVTAVFDTVRGTVSPKVITIEKGESATFKIIPNSGYLIDSLKYHGNVLPPLDTYTVKNISEDDTFEVKFKYKYEEGTLEWYFTQFVWVESLRFALVNGSWYDFTDNSIKRIFTYNTDGTYTKILNNDTFNNETWHFNKNADSTILIISGSIYQEKVEFCDSTKMVLSFINGNATMQITYINDGKRRFN